MKHNYILLLFFYHNCETYAGPLKLYDRLSLEQRIIDYHRQVRGAVRDARPFPHRKAEKEIVSASNRAAILRS